MELIIQCLEVFPQLDKKTLNLKNKHHLTDLKNDNNKKNRINKIHLQLLGNIKADLKVSLMIEIKYSLEVESNKKPMYFLQVFKMLIKD